MHIITCFIDFEKYVMKLKYFMRYYTQIYKMQSNFGPVFEITAGPLPRDRELCGKTRSFFCLPVLETMS